ncbi:choice-of-anchor E domain-containing protein [Sphingomonas endophytica]|nr:choice-of-anchor E domain-containing protein [Sphingomonas endophytica]
MANAASAATIIQTDSEQAGSRGFRGFDSALGTLNKVSLDISLSKSRVWAINVPAANAGIKTVRWTVDGNWRLGSSIASLDGLLVRLAGSGSDTVDMTRIQDGRALGFFDVIATGGASLSLDPTLFVDTATSFNGFDLGHNGDVGDTSFSLLPSSSQLRQLSGSCFVTTSGSPSSPAGEDFCGSASYKLTFDYTPAGAPTGAVPEPATWAMMLAGFATTGAALRRRRRRAAAAA